jgi:hypothetical protein
MQLIVDVDSRRLSLGPVPPVRGETIPGTLTFMKGGVPFRLPAGTAIQIGVKSWNDPSDVLLAYTTATRPEPDGAPYTFSLSLNTSEMLAKFTAGVTRYDCSIEVKWEVSAGSGTFKKTQRRKYSVDADTLRDTDANPSTMLSRNDFLVTNGTGLLVNVAAGYAANGAFVAAQASLAITNATNYIEVTAAGVASINTTAFTAGSYPLATVVASAGAITANTDLRAWITPKPAAAGGVTSITGTANEITVTGTTTPTLSLPSALTFTAKTVTGGTFASPTFTTPALGTPASGDFSTGAFTWPTFDQNTTGSAGSAATLTTTRTIGGANFNGSEDVTSFPSPGAIGGTTPNTIAGTTGTFSGDLITTGTSAQIYTSGAAAYLATYGAAAHIYTDGANAQIYTSGTFASISTGGSSAHISTGGSGAYIQTRSTFRLNGGTYVTTLSHAATANRAIALPDDSGTLALTSDITGGTLAGSFTTLTASATTSLLLGTAGSAVGTIGFRNATSGTTTLQPATGALGTGTVTLPLSGTLAISSGAQTFTGVQSMTSPAITTSITTPSTTFALVNATATTVNFAGGASTALNMGHASGTNTIFGTTIFSTPGSVDLQNGTSSSVFRVYGYYSDASNYCRISTSYNDGGNLFTISSDGLGTRANRNFGIISQAILYLGGNSTYAWRITSAGLLAHADNTYDIGASGATRPRHLYIGSNGVFGGTLSVTGASTLTGLLTANGGITLGDAQNIAFNTTTGTKIGATTSQKIGFWNSTPIVQPTTAVASATVAHAGGGTNIKTDDTFDGYTIAQVVKALRNAGLLA